MDAIGRNDGRWADPRRCYPEYPDGSVVEIRVHGVGGEPPSGMTRDHHPVMVGGDQLAGFHRARNPVVGTAGPEVADGRRQPLHVREVLAWGGQTSGTVRHAFWVLLLPFALFNLAGRMHVAGDPVRARRHRATCRVLALTLTLSVVALVSGLTFDLLAVQCAGWGQACLGATGDGPMLLAPMRRFSEDVAGRFGLAALVPALLLVALWYSGRYGTARLEGQTTGGSAAEERRADEPTALVDADFWRNAWPASRLRGLHASAALAWIGGTLALAVHLVHLELGTSGGAAALWPALSGVAAATVVGCLLVAWMPGVAAPGPDAGLHVVLVVLRLLSLGTLGVGVGATLLGHFLTGGTTRGAPGWVVVVLGVGGLALVLRWATGLGGSRSAFRLGDADAPDVSIATANGTLSTGALLLGGATSALLDGTVTRDAFLAPPLGAVHLPSWLDGLDGLLPGLFAAPYLPLVGLVVLQVVLVAWLGRVAFEWKPTLRDGRSELDDGSPVVGNLTAVVVALLTLLLVTAIGAGAHALILDALGDNVAASQNPLFVGDTVALTLPWWYALTALVVAATPVVGGAVWLVLAGPWRGWAPSASDVERHLAAAYDRTGQVPGPDLVTEREQLERIGKGWMTQRLIRDLGTLLAWTVGLLTVAVAAAAFVLRTRSGGLGAQIPLVAAATWLVALIPVAGVALIRSSLSDRSARREVGRLWDVLTFWPRVTHPFAPPCYGEALVPMLEQRVRRLLGATRSRPPTAPGNGQRRATEVPLHYRVIVAGHSQGSVVSLAVAARLGDPDAGAAVSDEARRRVALVSYGSPIAILYERYFRATLGDAAGGSLHDRVTRTVHSWHHFFGLPEPFAFPFWCSDGEPDALALRQGWAVSRSLCGIDEWCPVCDVAAPEVRQVERLVCDPDRWSLWDGRPVPVGGHSVYHRDVEVDGHLARIAGALVAASPAPASADPEQRADRWWRAGV